MPIVCHDFRCPGCGRLDADIYHEADVLVLCPDCGAEMVISWHTGQAPGLETFFVFRPVTVPGMGLGPDTVLHSKEDVAAYERRASAMHGQELRLDVKE